MACYNSSAYLDEAIDSVLNQTLRELELILIDDCSTDNSLLIAKRYESLDSRVSVLSLPQNQNVAFTRNIGIREARGKWLAILDSDDIAMPSRFEEQMKMADCNDDLVMIGSNAFFIDKNGSVIGTHRYPTINRNLVSRLQTHKAFPPHSSMVYRRDVVDRLSGFNIRYVSSEDYDLWFRLSEAGKMASLDKPLVMIRKHENNISNTEDGVLQCLYATAAAACHFIRSYGKPDPSRSFDEEIWQKFLAWIDHRMKEEGAFERMKAWKKIRLLYFEQNCLNGKMRFFIDFIRSGYALEKVWEKMFGSSLPRKLAEEWMKSGEH